MGVVARAESHGVRLLGFFRGCVAFSQQSGFPPRVGFSG